MSPSLDVSKTWSVLTEMPMVEPLPSPNSVRSNYSSMSDDWELEIYDEKIQGRGEDLEDWSGDSSETTISTASNNVRGFEYDAEDDEEGLKEDLTSTVVSAIPVSVVKVGDKKKCYLVWYTSPSNFFLQLENEDFNKLMNEIHDVSEKDMEALSEPDIVPGSTCLAKYSKDQHWYRAEVESVVDSEAAVRFFDYGNVETVSLFDLKKIKPEFLELPAQALNCKLFSFKSSWHDDETDSFFSKLDDKDLWVKFIGQESGIFLVSIQVLSEPIVPDASPFEENWEETEETSDDWAIEKLAATSDFSSFEENWDDENDSWVIKEFEITATSLVRGIPPATVKVGDKKKSSLVWYTDPSNFILQVPNQDFDNLMNKIDAIPEKEMEALYESDIVPGMTCLAKYSPDQHWYRAEVDSLVESLVAVRFLDYGNVDTVSSSDLKKINPEFLKLPAQAIHCELVGFESSWTSDEVSSLCRKLDCKDLWVEFVGEESEKFLVRIQEIMSDESFLSDFITCDVPDWNEIWNDPLWKKTWQNTTSYIPRWEINVPPPAVQVGDKKKCFAVWYTDPSDFVLQAANEEFDKLMDRIDAIPEKDLEALSESDIVPGLTCLAKYSKDQRWYRAEVESVVDSLVAVRFLDYGNVETVSTFDLKKINPEFSLLPAQALHCELVSFKSSWSANEINSIHTQLHGQDLWVSFVCKTSEEEKFLVCVQQIKSDESFLSDYVTSEIQNVSSYDVSGREENQEENDSDVSFKPKKSVGLLKISVSSQECKIPAPTLENTHETSISGKEEDELNNLLMSRMKKNNKTFLEVIPGLVCIAQYSKDKMWYRAVVDSVYESEAVVRFVDYGNVEIVEFANLRKIEPELLEFSALTAEEDNLKAISNRFNSLESLSHSDYSSFREDWESELNGKNSGSTSSLEYCYEVTQQILPNTHPLSCC